MIRSQAVRFSVRWVVAGLALAFILVAAKPELLLGDRADHGRGDSRTTLTVEPRYRESYALAVSRAAPAVVSVHTTKLVLRPPDQFGRSPSGQSDRNTARPGIQTNLGSGVILDREGYIVTNNHLIQGVDQINVILPDGRESAATVVGTDPDTDLAVLRVTLRELPALDVDQPARLRVGDVALAIGNPFGVGQTVTMGIVSATGRTQLGLNTFEDFVQTDAAINPGNSGGALVNARGELIGINTAIFTRSGGSHGIGFAIPATLAGEVMRAIIARGYVPRGWLGIDVRELDRSLAEWLGTGDVRGILVTGVVAGSPADTGGLIPGDVIIAVDDASIANSQNALNSIAGAQPGSEVRLRIIRAGRTMGLAITIGERPRRDT